MIQKYLIKVGIFLLNCSYSVFKLLPTNSNKVLFLSRQSNKPSIDFRMIVSQLEEDRDVKIVIMTKRIEKNERCFIQKCSTLFTSDVSFGNFKSLYCGWLQYYC